MRDLAAIYEPAFRALLWRVRARRLELGVQLLLHRARANSLALGAQSEHQADDAYRAVYQRARAQTIRQLVRARVAGRRGSALRGKPLDARVVADAERVLDHAIAVDPLACTGDDVPADFYCDAGLGGMARWLRAAGYDARFFPGIDDDVLLRETMNSCAIMLTTDRPLVERAAVRWGAVPALLVPFSLGKQAQFRFVADRLGLPKKKPRCMACGGRLVSVDKEANRHRIPPRTFPWVDCYFECHRCGKLFWPGTHWQRVERVL